MSANWPNTGSNVGGLPPRRSVPTHAYAPPQDGVDPEVAHASQVGRQGQTSPQLAGAGAPPTFPPSGRPTPALPAPEPGSQPATGGASPASLTPAGPAAAGGLPSRRTRAQRPRKSGPGWFALVVAMALTAALSVGATTALSQNEALTIDSITAQSEPTQSGQAATPPVAEPLSSGSDWEAVAAAVRPSTVSIYVENAEQSGAGSGVVLDTAGHIVTNNHVVAPVGADGQLQVQTFDGRVFAAEIVGTDPTTDLAVIQLDQVPADIRPAYFNDSEELEVGQPVMAIGAPLGLADTVTTGIISALDRPVVVQGDDPASPAGAQAEAVVTNAIQVDASINPGNSGGPLFDAAGSVIGINSSIATNQSADGGQAGSIGLGFAIPASLAKSVATQIIETGSASHALLGVTIRTGVTELGDAHQMGAVVEEVSPGGAGAGAGLQKGDVIVGINGEPVTSGSALTGFVRRYQQGDEVVLDVVRAGAEQQVTATLQER